MYKVLVCDDEKDIVSAISIYLTSDGYERLQPVSRRDYLVAIAG